MPISIIYSATTGRQKRLAVGSNTVSVNDPLTEVYVEIPRFASEPDPALFMWDRVTHDYVDVPNSPNIPISRNRINQEEFWDKFTDAEIEMLHQLRVDPATALVKKAKLEAVNERMRSRTYINLTRQKVIDDVTWLVAQIANAGIITDTAPSRQARVAQILTPLTTNETL